MNQNEEFDAILDQAMSEYRDAEPLAGLEQRVLHKVQVRQRSRVWLTWGTIAAFAAVLIAGLWLGSRDLSTKQQQAAIISAAPQVHSPAKNNSPQRQPTATKNLKTVEPKLSHRASPGFASARTNSDQRPEQNAERPQFPVPEPLTAEEHALLALAQTHPEVLLDSPDPAKPLTIPPIQIRPLPDSLSSTQGDN